MVQPSFLGNTVAKSLLSWSTRTTSTLPTGIVTGPKISPNLRSALPKLGGEKAARVRDVAGRK